MVVVKELRHLAIILEWEGNLVIGVCFKLRLTNSLMIKPCFLKVMGFRNLSLSTL
jgi:hypothetical protein